MSLSQVNNEYVRKRAKETILYLQLTKFDSLIAQFVGVINQTTQNTVNININTPYLQFNTFTQRFSRMPKITDFL